MPTLVEYYCQTNMPTFSFIDIDKDFVFRYCTGVSVQETMLNGEPAGQEQRNLLTQPLR